MPAPQFTAEMKEEAIGLIREMMDNSELSGLTLAEIARKTGIAMTNIVRWRNEIKYEQSEESQQSEEKKKPRRKKANNGEHNYERDYRIAVLTNEYLSRGLLASEEERDSLEIAYLRELLSQIFGHQAPPLFSSRAEPPPKKYTKKRG